MRGKGGVVVQKSDDLPLADGKALIAACGKVKIFWVAQQTHVGMLAG